MATRLNRRHGEMVKDKIRASQLVNRLQNHALGKEEMTKTQVTAAAFLLNKIIPNPPTDITNSDGSLSAAFRSLILDESAPRREEDARSCTH